MFVVGVIVGCVVSFCFVSIVWMLVSSVILLLNRCVVLLMLISKLLGVLIVFYGL